ncbi:hypothetical protein V9K97_17750 [Variovorax sp. CCNWLW186]|uniref:hypothetical protein n=1 Tax=Variovorax sp. CCNWLW186 TaxID=3127473 RepID=UPI00307877DD
MAATMRTRVNFGVPHLISAALFSRQTKALEQFHHGEVFGPFWNDILANATATVFTSVAGLESYANELFADRASVFPGIPDETLRAEWRKVERGGLLEKFNLALRSRSAPELSEQDAAWSDVVTLIRLRNALVHFKPEWADAQVVHADLSAKLAQHFAPSPFTPAEPLFPMAWASHACTAWAVQTVLKFIVHFEGCAGLTNRIGPFLSRLSDS